MTGFMLVAIVCGNVVKVWDGIQETEAVQNRAREYMTRGFFAGVHLIAESIQVRYEYNDGTTKLFETWNSLQDIENSAL